MTTLISHTVDALGPLRLGLAAVTLLAVALMPAPGTGIHTDGWNAFVTVVVPALAPLLVAAYLLDLLMALVLMKDKTASERRRYRWIIVSDLAFMALLLIAFVPLVLALRR
jgi:hypothetical protein